MSFLKALVYARKYLQTTYPTASSEFRKGFDACVEFFEKHQQESIQRNYVVETEMLQKRIASKDTLLYSARKRIEKLEEQLEQYRQEKIQEKDDFHQFLATSEREELVKKHNAYALWLSQNKNKNEKRAIMLHEYLLIQKRLGEMKVKKFVPISSSGSAP